MSYQTIIDQIAIILDQVSGAGANIHKFIRSLQFWNEFFAEHKDGARILTWEITRLATAEQVATVQNAVGNEPNFHDTHNFAIVGRMALQDSTATETEFQTILSDIQAEFRQNNDLNGTVIIPKQLQIRSVGHEMYGGVLCHHAALTFEAIERVGG